MTARKEIALSLKEATCASGAALGERPKELDEKINRAEGPHIGRGSEMAPEQIYEIPLEQVKVSKENVRHEGQSDDELSELAESIKLHGQLQPAVLEGNYGSPPYQLIIGQRRYLAISGVLKQKTIKATFCGKISKTNAIIRSLAENLCRVELSYKDTADAVTELYKTFKRDDREVAKVTGLSLKRVRQYIYIEERASDTIKAKLRDGTVTPQDVKRALRAAHENVAKAEELLDLMSEYDAHVKKRAAEYAEAHPKASAKEIIEKANAPIVERQLLVKLSDVARKGLEVAAEQLRMAPDEVASQALSEWLTDKGFVS